MVAQIELQRQTEMSASASPVRTPAVAALHELFPQKLRRRRRRPKGGASKRAFDFTVSFIALFILSPLLLLLTLLIKLDSPGPVFFLQRRGGLWGGTFLIYKFRTMTSLDDGRHVEQATKKDDRVTRVGTILRATSLDELPQLLNVLRGEMSLVGPRPHAVAHDRRFLEIDPGYSARFSARPGITGLAQVSGCRGLSSDDASVRRRTEYDARYVQTQSLWMDMGILARTTLVIFGDANAH